MANEVERKFLVDALPEGFDTHPHMILKQGYLAIARDGSETRIRRSSDGCTLTIKQGKGLTRCEEEITISADLFDSLWPMTAGRRIQKSRHRIPSGELTIELDRYEGDLAGLVVAEVEFLSEETAKAWRPPSWFGREVTDDPAYKNQQLALHGRPTR